MTVVVAPSPLLGKKGGGGWVGLVDVTSPSLLDGGGAKRSAKKHKRRAIESTQAL
jgi:hypothetical protein